MAALRVGLVGFGIMGELYAETIKVFDDATLVAVAEVDEARRAAAGARHDCGVFSSHAEMFERANLDTAIIALPDFMHRAPVIAAAQAGLPILLEKPFATNLEDAQAMMQAIDTAGVACSIEFSNRWGAPFAQARERVRDGQLGDVLSVSADLNDTVFVPMEMLSWAGQSSPAWFLMSHTADLVAWITGKRPTRVFAKGTKQFLAAHGIDTYDVIEALVEYDDGTTGRLTSGWVLPQGFPLIYELKMRIVGTKAAIDIDMSDQNLHFFDHTRLEHPPTSVGVVHGRHVGGIHNMIRDFVLDTRAGVQPMTTVQDGFENTCFLVAVHESLRSNGPVDI
ncbi:MAG: Gfo/Idh/MocA family oxidoreductase [Nitrospiraceae bacterium]|nr:Gfo/Idh/MocA family oxidoreductase [Nitrospiraceae bacterium]